MSAAEEELAWQLSTHPLRTPSRFVREFVFAKPRRWRFDFAWPDLKVAVEVDGGVWVGGRHTRGVGFERDTEKFNTAALLGWLVLRVTPGQVRSGEALAWVIQALAVPHEVPDHGNA